MLKKSIRGLSFRLNKSLIYLFIKINSVFYKNKDKRLLNLFYFFKRSIKKYIIVDDIIFDCTNEMSLKRANWFLTKEPNTQKWIKNYFSDRSVFYDIGACVGEYSLLAAKKSGATVYAFEPSAPNYAVLNKNIYLNRLDNKITALNIALNNKSFCSFMETSRKRYIPGKSYNHFHETKKECSIQDETFRQGMIGYSLDSLIQKYDLPFPNHIKIDVDGNEDKIIMGMRKVLGNIALKSIAIEIDNYISFEIDIIAIIKENGFKEIKEFPFDYKSKEPNNIFFERI